MERLREEQLHEYQRYCVERIMKSPAVGLFLDMGLGKTVTTLTALKRLLYDEFENARVLVIAPLRVAHTVWAEEAQRWEHLKDLRFSKILGSAEQRRQALDADADIYVINRENVVWLVEELQKRKSHWWFDCVVIDELSSFKDAKSKRFRALRKVRPLMDRIIGLTGTPAPNGLMDLWTQIYLLDRGESLGRTLSAYRDAYFVPGKRNGNVVYEWKLKEGAEKAIYERLQGRVVSMRAEDYIELPERLDIEIPIDLDEKTLKAYRQMEKEMVIPLASEEYITAQNAAAVCMKLLQLSGGSIYDENGKAHDFHSAKLEALEELVEAANGKPVLCYYGFRFEAERILAKFPLARKMESPGDIEDWNEGKIPLMIAHPDSAGHGLNLQKGGHIMVWYGLPWSLEKYQQANARLYRQGQKETTRIYHLVAKGTIDEKVMKVLKRKDQTQSALMQAVKAVIEDEFRPSKDQG